MNECGKDFLLEVTFSISFRGSSCRLYEKYIKDGQVKAESLEIYSIGNGAPKINW